MAEDFGVANDASSEASIDRVRLVWLQVGIALVSAAIDNSMTIKGMIVAS